MLKSILNKKHALTSLTDAEFEALLPQLAAELESHGVLRETYADADIQKDWALLLKKDVTTNAMNISATEVAGMKVMRKHMLHFHAVRNYKGHSVESLWTQPCLEKALRFNRAQHSTPYASEIIRSLSFANGLGKVTMYRPLMAKKVVAYLANHLGVQEVRVLDVCAGWGGRMIGAKSAESPSFAGVSPSVAGGLRGELVSPLKVHYTRNDRFQKRVQPRLVPILWSNGCGNALRRFVRVNFQVVIRRTRQRNSPSGPRISSTSPRSSSKSACTLDCQNEWMSPVRKPTLAIRSPRR